MANKKLHQSKRGATRARRLRALRAIQKASFPSTSHLSNATTSGETQEWSVNIDMSSTDSLTLNGSAINDGKAQTLQKDRLPTQTNIEDNAKCSTVDTQVSQNPSQCSCPPSTQRAQIPHNHDATSTRKRWKKVHVTQTYNCEDTQAPETVERMVLTTSCIQQLANAMLEHGKVCPSARAKTMRIVNGNISFDCNGCKQSFVVNQDLGLEHFPYEKALTLATFASGTGYEAVNTILTTLQIPELTFYKFEHNEKLLFDELKKAKHAEFLKNAQEEYRLAMEAGDWVEVNGIKIPFITVVVDGGWSKRSYRHSYDSKSGVAVIIGARTKKVLWMDTRIKVCAKCDHAERNGKQAENHTCFKNWNGSAQAMEADIIVEGFKKSLADYGLIYRYVIGDADSSVIFKIKSSVSYPGGIEIQKIDCVNHATRGITSKLHGISKNTTFEKAHRDIVSSRIVQMTGDVRGAINHNSKLYHAKSNSGSIPPAKRLFNDIINIPSHVFGDHTRCDPYFCKKVGEKDADLIRDSKIFSFVRTAFQQLAQRSDRLIHNLTSNLAEGFMAQMCKYTSGKRCSQSLSYGYLLRSFAAVFAYDYGEFWPAAVYSQFYGITNNLWSHKYNRCVEYRKREKKKPVPKHKKTAKQKDLEYGEDPYDIDVEQGFLKSLVDELAAELQVTPARRNQIQLCTIGQAFNDEWKFQRRNRVTASHAGKIFKMRDSTNNSSCIKHILYPVDLSKNEHVQRGVDFEHFAKLMYEKDTGKTVTECGLFVSQENGILAASPDGLIDDNGIVEFKCPSVPPLLLCDRKDKILLKDESNPLKFRLNRNHCYYYQVIMQIYVADKSYCDFAIYHMDKTTGKEELWIETIVRSKETDELWGNMKQKLIRFFMEDLAPEIVRPRHVQKLAIRQPMYRIEACLKNKTGKNNQTGRKRKICNVDDS